MILIVNFSLVENALLEKVSGELGVGERCQYIQNAITTPQALGKAFKRQGNELPRVIIINLDSYEADWKMLLTNLKENDIWRFVPVLGFGFLDDDDGDHKNGDELLVGCVFRALRFHDGCRLGL